MKPKERLCLILPSLSAGGMERVMSQLAFYFCSLPTMDVYFILMTKGELFYDLPNNISIYQPKFNHKKYSRLRYSYLTFRFVRKTLKNIQPNKVLTFGGKYNSFVLLSAIGLGIDVFISDRSRPDISYGKLLDKVNLFVYRNAKGIIAQTKKAQEVLTKRFPNTEIKVIGNPIRQVERKKNISRENIILNIGRLIPSKQQSLLVEFFSIINPVGWKLIFLGDGSELPLLKKKVDDLGLDKKIIFMGNQKNIDEYFLRAKIFSFTSISEGFPNALGEAMNAGLSCISFDCNAGPSDLIDHGKNGFLVAVGDNHAYLDNLKKLILDPDLRKNLGLEGMKKMKNFELEKIGKQYYDFIFKS